ncbi:MAG: thiamine diphosphokinase [Clostridia bacterium]|nr:thiamine diphosphokinase [Clostridia bacterium]
METTSERGIALILTGGYCHIDAVRDRLPPHPGIVIAADSGLKTAEALGLRPDIVMGDFDSYTDPLPEGIEVIRIPAEKDVTDTVLAADYAQARGFTDLLIVGGTGGRLDHELSNLLLLAALRERGLCAVLTDGDNTVRVLRDERAAIPDEGGYFSLIAPGECRATIRGAKYPLERAKLDRAHPSYGVSNEVTGSEAEVCIEGEAFLITSRR